VALPHECHSRGVSSAPEAAHLGGRSSAFGPPVHAPAPAPLTVAPPLRPIQPIGPGPGDLLEQVWNFWASEPGLCRLCSRMPPSMGVAARVGKGICLRRARGQRRSLVSINILEMKAVILGVPSESTLRGKCMTLFSDNLTVVAYIRKQGGLLRTPCAN
jgi:hypothetical protein